LFAIGIRFVGETVAKKLAKHYKSIDALANASVEDLEKVDEIGVKIAESVVSFFSLEAHQLTIQRLKDYGVQLAVSEEVLANQTNKLEGKSFVVSGVFETISRDELKKLIENNGGKNVSSISSKTDFVVAGDKMGPSKKEKAEKLKIPLISEADFLRIIN
jgi:DNA ligase (NAD+)